MAHHITVNGTPLCQIAGSYRRDRRGQIIMGAMCEPLYLEAAEQAVQQLQEAHPEDRVALTDGPCPIDHRTLSRDPWSPV